MSCHSLWINHQLLEATFPLRVDSNVDLTLDVTISGPPRLRIEAAVRDGRLVSIHAHDGACTETVAESANIVERVDFHVGAPLWMSIVSSRSECLERVLANGDATFTSVGACSFAAWLLVGPVRDVWPQIQSGRLLLPDVGWRAGCTPDSGSNDE